MRHVLSIRISDESKQDPQSQIDSATEWLLKNKNKSFDCVVEDRGSGYTIKLEDTDLYEWIVSEGKRGDIIYVNDASRLGRNELRLWSIYELCTENKIAIWSISDNANLLADRDLFNMRSWMSRLEYDKISFRSRNGHRTRTSRGGGLGFGYEDNKIKPDEFRILWLIHYLHLAGVSYQRIADHLNLAGLKTRNKVQFSKQWVYKLCKQKKMEFFENKTPAESLTLMQNMMTGIEYYDIGSFPQWGELASPIRNKVNRHGLLVALDKFEQKKCRCCR